MGGEAFRQRRVLIRKTARKRECQTPPLKVQAYDAQDAKKPTMAFPPKLCPIRRFLLQPTEGHPARQQATFVFMTTLCAQALWNKDSKQ